MGKHVVHVHESREAYDAKVAGDIVPRHALEVVVEEALKALLHGVDLAAFNESRTHHGAHSSVHALRVASGRHHGDLRRRPSDKDDYSYVTKGHSKQGEQGTGGEVPWGRLRARAALGDLSGLQSRNGVH